MNNRCDYLQMYYEFEEKYNTCPCYMSYSAAFGAALANNDIDEDTYHKARKYFGTRWNYTGD